MGCGGSKEQEPKKKEGNTDAKYQQQQQQQADDPQAKSQTYDVNDPEVAAVLARKDSAAVHTDEPAGFVSKMKQMYQTRKAKFNGANEDVDQYMDEILQSIPVMSKKDKDRVQQWVNAVWDANLPGPVFEEVIEGIQPRSQQQAQAQAQQQQQPHAEAADGSKVETRSSDPNTVPSLLILDPSGAHSPTGTGARSSGGGGGGGDHNHHHPLAVPRDEQSELSDPKTPVGHHLFNASSSDYPRSGHHHREEDATATSEPNKTPQA